MKGIIAISGKSGCGNSTVSDMVARSLKFDLVNYTFKNLAVERGMTVERVMELSKDDDSFDLDVDRKQVEEARKGGKVIGSRLAVWLLKDDADLRIYLWASHEVRARRIREREGAVVYGDPEFTKQRDLADHTRYKRLYGYDNDDYSGVDLVINAERFDAESIAELIIAAFKIREGSESGIASVDPARKSS